MDMLAGTIAEHGFALARQAISADARQMLLEAMSSGEGSSAAGRRGVLSIPAVAEVARSEAVLRLVRPHVAPVRQEPAAEPRPVRGIWFDKSPTANWLVAWHQDLAIAVRERIETPGFTAWSVKDGVPHVQPPCDLLESMLTVRLHLDDADATNGALRVLPGSHRSGRLSAAQIEAFRAEQAEVVCEARAGDALLLRPLLLHASGRSSREGHRRVLHLEYAACDLPGGLAWDASGDDSPRPLTPDP